MSLINQMLKDLEQRGGFPSDTKFEPAKSKSLGTAQDNDKPHKHTFLKISGILILLYCAVYLWVKNPDALNSLKSLTTPAQTAQPQAVPTPPVAATPQPTVSPPVVPAENPTASPEVVEPQAVQDISTHTENAQPNVDAHAHQSEVTPKEKIALDHPQKTKTTHETTSKKDKLISPSNDHEPLESAENKTVTKPLNEAPIAQTDAISPNIKKSKPLVNHAVNSTQSFNKLENPTQKSANLYRAALVDIQKGRTHEAEDNLAKAIGENPNNEEARQTLAALMVDNKKMIEAKDLLTEGLKLNPEQTGFRMAVARLQLEAGDKQSALDNLFKGLPYARKNADYQSFLATLLQRSERHAEAIDYYRAAINLESSNPNTYIGIGISLQSVGEFQEAQNAFNRALSYDKLSPELTDFVEQRLKQVNQRLTSE